MSAFVVDREHIDILVHAGLAGHRLQLSWLANNQSYEIDRSKAADVGQMLWDENIKSVSYRYPDDDPDSLPGPISETFVFERNPDWIYGMSFELPKLVQVMKAISSYEYQSCEHEEWETSEAKAYCEALRAKMIRLLPGYDEADWAVVA